MWRTKQASLALGDSPSLLSTVLGVVPQGRILKEPKYLPTLFWGVPYYHYSIRGPNTLFQLVRRLYSEPLKETMLLFCMVPLTMAHRT